VKKKRQKAIAIVKAQLRELTLQWMVQKKIKKLNTIWVSASGAPK